MPGFFGHSYYPVSDKSGKTGLAARADIFYAKYLYRICLERVGAKKEGLLRNV
jgi:hypothetical protein